MTRKGSCAAAPLRMTRKGQLRRRSAQDDTKGVGALSVQGDKEGHPYFYNAAAKIRSSLKSRKFLASLLKEIS